MRHRFLGRSGLQVSELALGTMSFGDRTDEGAAHTIMDEYTAAGGTFIDTADVYQFGESERIIGTWLRSQDRDQLVIATKAYGESASGGPTNGAGRKHLIRAVDASLRRLGTDYIDLFQIHVFDDATPFEETLSTLDQLVRSGKVRFVGASNYTGWQLQKSIDLAQLHGWEPVVSVQPLYNLLRRDIEMEVLPVSRNEGLGVICWSPLEGGWLSGRYTRDLTSPPAGSRHADQPQAWHDSATEERWRVVDAVLAAAVQLDHSPAQVALRWLLQQPDVTAPIIGARTVEQLRDNLGATDWVLPDDVINTLTDASEPSLPYPYPYPYQLQRLPQFVRRQV